MQRQHFQAGALNTELINDLRQLHYQKNIRTQQRNSQHTEAARSSKNGWLSTCLLKADFKSFGTRLVTREIRSQVEKREKHTFEFDIQYF